MTQNTDHDEKLVPIIPQREDIERYLLQMIHQIDMDAQKARKPLIDQLVRLRMSDPPPPILITKEQAVRLRFPGYENLS